MFTPRQLATMRAAHTLAMTSTVTVHDYEGGWELVDGVEVPQLGPEVYRGPAKLQSAAIGNAEVTAGGVPLSVSAYVGTVPWDVELAAGQMLTVTMSDDPHIIGRQFRIVGVEFNALAITARRFHAELLSDQRPQT